MAARNPDEYLAWRNEITTGLLAVYPLPEGKKNPSHKLLKDRKRVIEPYPLDILDCLQKDTAWWKQHRWSQPPGAQRVVYCDEAILSK